VAAESTSQTTRAVTYSIVIDAAPHEVFPYLVDPALMVRWMGDYAVLEPKPDGTFQVDINGVPVRGRYVSVEPPNRVVVTWGMAGSDTLPPGSSTVEFVLTPDGASTVVVVTHSGLPSAMAEQHYAGWSHFGERLAIAAQGDDPGPDPWATR
jgi:uncharacterized protein YndB with AHSA1/START domain